MLKGKFKYIVLTMGVLLLSFGIMRYTPLAFGNTSNIDDFQESAPFYERFMRGPRGHHRMMWDYDGEEDWEDFRQEVEENWEEYRQEGTFFRGHRGPRGCMGYYYDDYRFDEGTNK